MPTEKIDGYSFSERKVDPKTGDVIYLFKKDGDSSNNGTNTANSNSGASAAGSNNETDVANSNSGTSKESSNSGTGSTNSNNGTDTANQPLSCSYERRERQCNQIRVGCLYIQRDSWL